MTVDAIRVDRARGRGAGARAEHQETVVPDRQTVPGPPAGAGFILDVLTRMLPAPVPTVVLTGTPQRADELAGWLAAVGIDAARPGPGGAGTPATVAVCCPRDDPGHHRYTARALIDLGVPEPFDLARPDVIVFSLAAPDDAADVMGSAITALVDLAGFWAAHGNLHGWRHAVAAMRAIDPDRCRPSCYLRHGWSAAAALTMATDGTFTAQPG